MKTRFTIVELGPKTFATSFTKDALTMHRLSMNEVTTYRWSFEEDIVSYLEAGYEAIGVWRQKLLDFGEEQGVDLLAESGLYVTNLHWAGGFTGSDGHTFDESVDEAAHAIRLAGALDAGCLVVYPGGRNHHTSRHAERLLRSALDQLLPLAEGADVTLAIEPMHPACAAEWTFLTDLQSTIALINDYRTPHLKFVLDTYHFGNDRAVRSHLAELIPHIALVQLADRRCPHGIDHNRCCLGEGGVPLAEIMQELLSLGYQGDFDIELVGQDIELCEYEHLLINSKQKFDQWLAPAHAQSGS